MNTEPLELKIGALVQLKSGGPVMTVYETHPNDHVAVIWYPGQPTERYCRELFPTDALFIVPPVNPEAP